MFAKAKKKKKAIASKRTAAETATSTKRKKLESEEEKEASVVDLSKAYFLSELAGRVRSEPMKAAAAASVCELTLVLPNDSVRTRRFYRSQTLGEVLEYCQVELGCVDGLHVQSVQGKPATGGEKRAISEYLCGRDEAIVIIDNDKKA